MMKNNSTKKIFGPRYVMGLVFGVSIMSIFSMGMGVIFFGLLLGISISLCLVFFGKE
jgi:uncharacterized membrane protein